MIFFNPTVLLVQMVLDGLIRFYSDFDPLKILKG